MKSLAQRSSAQRLLAHLDLRRWPMAVSISAPVAPPRPPAGGPLAAEHLSPVSNSLTVRETTLGALRMRQTQSVWPSAREFRR